MYILFSCSKAFVTGKLFQHKYIRALSPSPLSVDNFDLESFPTYFTMADVEKTEHQEQLERISTKDELSPQNSLDKVATNETLAKVDLLNRQAFQGDDSDGKLHWTIRKWFAAAFLAMLCMYPLGYNL